MNELIGAWVHGHANGHYGGSHDFWLVFTAGGIGSCVYNGWWLYRLDAFRWNACSAARTFRVVNMASQFVDQADGLGGLAGFWMPPGWYSYAIREGAPGEAPSLVVTLPGWLGTAEFLLQTRDPMDLDYLRDERGWMGK